MENTHCFASARKTQRKRTYGWNSIWFTIGLISACTISSSKCLPLKLHTLRNQQSPVNGESSSQLKGGEDQLSGSSGTLSRRSCHTNPREENKKWVHSHAPDGSGRSLLEVVLQAAPNGQPVLRCKLRVRVVERAGPAHEQQVHVANAEIAKGAVEVAVNALAYVRNVARVEREVFRDATCGGSFGCATLVVM